MTGAELITASLKKNSVKHIFAYPGAAICPVIDSLSESNIKTILTRGEQAAAHMASGYAKATGRAGVCVATSGPGATNLITGIAAAYMDSVPMVILTGQVQTDLIGKDAFQEADITGATEPFIKHNYLIVKPEDIESIISEAFYIANTGRPGPVLIDIPFDIQNAMVKKKNINHSFEARGYNFTKDIAENKITEASCAVREAERPLILAGGGCIISKAEKVIRNLTEKTDIPVVSTMNGLGTVKSDYRNFYGMVGIHGRMSANYAVSQADLLIVLGARLGNRSFANFDLSEFEQKIIHVDIDPAEIGKNIQPYLAIEGDVKSFTELLTVNLDGYKAKVSWVEKLRKLKSDEKSEISKKNGFVDPKYFVRSLSEKVSDELIATEVGQNQIWTVNNFKVKFGNQLLMSAGLGAMGYGLPAAIGASVATGKKVFVISGDGSFQMNFAELSTVLRHNLPIKTVIFRNNSLGMIREIQKEQYGKHYFCENLDCSPDFCKIADAYGIESMRIDDNSQVESAIEKLISDDSAYVLEVMVDPDETTV